MAEKNTKPKELDFEKCITRLTQISDMLSNNEISLENALTLYEEGTALIKRCNFLIEDAEKRISVVETGKRKPASVEDKQ